MNVLSVNELEASKPGLKPGLWAFLCPKPGQSPLQARDLGRAGPGSNGPGFGRLWALGPAQHITSCAVWGRGHLVARVGL